MDFLSFGKDQMEDGSLDGMLQQAGIDDVGSFVNQFRGQANQQAQQVQQSPDFMSMGGSFLNQFSGSKDSPDMVQGAFNAYKMFSGGQSGGQGGGVLDDISSTYDNAQKMYALYKQFDKNGDGKITAEDIQIYLQEMGLGAVSPYMAKGLFKAVDKNGNGNLDFTDLMALSAMVNQLSGKFGGGGA
ncbi:hypothetical protein I4U23_025322 [Adineta vaga]|nr:hypothetical protein I4U23_025322 [Adineta vaga]